MATHKTNAEARADTLRDWSPEALDWYSRTPKRVLGEMLRHYAARLTGDSYDQAIIDGSWLDTARAEAERYK